MCTLMTMMMMMMMMAMMMVIEVRGCRVHLFRLDDDEPVDEVGVHSPVILNVTTCHGPCHELSQVVMDLVMNTYWGNLYGRS